MKLSVKQAIYRAVNENKWLDIDYVNQKQERTDYFIGIKDIDIKSGRISCDIFNCFKKQHILKKDRDIQIRIEGILSARVIEQSFYLSDASLLRRIEKDEALLSYLEAEAFDNNILGYLSDCYKMDNDPYIKDTLMLDGIDIRELKKNRSITLSDEDFELILERLFKRSRAEAEFHYRYVDMAINSFSIDINGKQYVVAYYKLNLNFATKALSVEKDVSINPSFLIEDKKVSLSSYLEMDQREFCVSYNGSDEAKQALIRMIEENFSHGEMVNTRPSIFLIERALSNNVDATFESIAELEKEGKLQTPIKAFFGRNRAIAIPKKDASVVVFDKSKVNIDQMRVVYNAMVSPVTYVQGPPGTGKTETIFNVLLSAYANAKKVLICSNNNHPIDDIAARMMRSTFSRTYQGKPVSDRLPFLRLGNSQETIKAILTLREDLSRAEDYEKLKANEVSTLRSKEGALSSFSELRDLLVQFEQRIDVKERLDKLSKIETLAKNDAMAKEIQKQKAILSARLSAIPKIRNEMIGDYVISAKDSDSFHNYMFYSGVLCLKKLLSPVNEELRSIILTKDLAEASSRLNRYLKDPENLRKFLEIYPLIATTNLSSDRLATPMPHFDLCIMDEAGQCNVATSLIPIIRAKALLLVGDVNQLQPVTVIEPAVNERLRDKYAVSDDYDYMSNSILSAMQRKDENSKSILLSYHYRCGKKIAGFSNDRFYQGQLKLENAAPGKLVYCDVKNIRHQTKRNSSIEEAEGIVNLIAKNHYEDVGIITPFVNQANLINDLLRAKGIEGVKAGTVHMLQGSEKSTIILSAALSPRTGSKTMDWIKNNHELINVAVTRAKERFVFVGDKEAINLLSGTENNDIKSLSDYVYSNGESIVPAITDRSFSNYSNDSESEKEFFETIAPYFNKRKQRMRVERNVPMKKAIPNLAMADLQLTGKKEFDVIIQVSEGMVKRRYRTIVAFEIDGGEHIGSKQSAKNDRLKENICANYGVKLIRIANNQVKDYQLIIALFECVVKAIPDIETGYVQGSLFELDEPSA